DGADQAQRAVAVPAEAAGGGEARFRGPAAGCAVRGLCGGRRHPPLEPADLAGPEVGAAAPGLGLRITDPGARADVLRVTGGRDVVRDDGVAGIARGLRDVHDGVAAAGLRRDRLDALLARDVGGLDAARLAGFAAAPHLVAALDLAPDVLEQLLLLLLEEPALAFGLAFLRRGA